MDPEKTGKSEDSEFYKICINVSHIYCIKEMTRKEAVWNEMPSCYSDVLRKKKWNTSSELVTVIYTDGLKNIFTYQPLKSILAKIRKEAKHEC